MGAWGIYLSHVSIPVLQPKGPVADKEFRLFLLILGLLAVLTLIQFLVQLFFFLHVGREFSPRFKLMMTTFMILVVIILVGGSLWIMHSLNGRVMPSTKQKEQYMNAQDNL
ncbi:cytochrome C oxidase subunit IV family protein [Patescibacteria group bacterium]|nr:cytochrome C oxidase subunit IV family protein [Patescibacteria group bacterium]